MATKTKKEAVVGGAVVVSISQPRKWNAEAAKVLDGSLGIVEQIKEKSSNSYDGVSPAYLVRLTPPRIFGNATESAPVTAFWFDRSDLVVT